MPTCRDKPSTPRAATGKQKAGTLAAIVGIVAAAGLLGSIPEDESGRTVKVDMAADGSAKVIHIAGKQYLRAYLDIAGVATACDGITRGVKMGQTYTEAQCAALLEREIVRHARPIMLCAPLLQAEGRDYQRWGVVSFGYNLGVGSVCGNTGIGRALRAGNFVAACDAMLAWNKARVRGRLVVVKGLDRRRNREREVCLTNLVPGKTPANLAARVEKWK